jgi:ADP-heptose:LPS heptosyltransferase
MTAGGLPDVIRAPNHLGDFIMALPALAAAPEADLVLSRWLVPLAAMLQRGGATIPLERGAGGLLGAAMTLRRSHRSSGVLLAPSFSSALLFRLGGVRRVRGTATDGRRALLTQALPRERLRGLHRTALYLELVTGRAAGAAPVPAPAGSSPAAPAAPGLKGGGGGAGVPLRSTAGLPAPLLPLPAALRAAWRDRHDLGPGRVVGIFPGSNAPSRRWDAERFAAVAEGLTRAGARVFVFGAPQEAALTRTVAGRVATDMGGRTDLPMLAAALAECDILVTNDSGPMHLAAAVGTRVLVVSGPADTEETAPGGSGHVYLQRLDLPCVPCVRNECPRQGAGFLIPEAERECLRLIQAPDVLAAASRMLHA